jgi:hypothetical protein
MGTLKALAAGDVDAKLLWTRDGDTWKGNHTAAIFRDSVNNYCWWDCCGGTTLNVGSTTFSQK